MERGRAVLISAIVMALVGLSVVFAQGSGADILKDMMSDDQMTALQAIGKLRSDDIAGQKEILEKAKNNLIVLIGNKKKDYTIRLTAADTAAYFEVKKAIPVLKSAMASDQNPMIQLTFKNALDRLEGRISGEKYQGYGKTPSYMGTPSYYGTPGR